MTRWMEMSLFLLMLAIGSLPVIFALLAFRLIGFSLGAA